jgi:signal transduction histidine kinase/CheY-like chemotaxis protein
LYDAPGRRALAADLLHGKVVYPVGLVTDLAAILEELPVAVWVGNVPDGTTAYANRACAQIGGPPVIGLSISGAPAAYGLVTRDGSPYPVEQLPFSRVVETGAPVVVDDVVIRRGELDVHVRAFGAPVVDANGRLTHVIVAFSDISNEIAARSERQSMEERLRFAYEHAPIAVWTTDAAGVITMSEGAGLAPLGVKPGQLVGQKLLDVYGDHPTIPGYIRRGFAGESFWYTVEVGKAVYNSWLAPLRGPSGEMIGLAGLSHDISELHHLQRTTIQNDRVIALGTLAASVAHEINNPLTYVLSHGEDVERELDALEALIGRLEGSALQDAKASLRRVREGFAPIRSGTSRIWDITRDLRTFSRPEESSLGPVDLRGVVLSVLKLVAKEVEARARLVLDLHETPPISGNEGRMVQVVLNLMVNAMQALPVDGSGEHEVVVRTGGAGTDAFVEVSDSGPGVPAADRERIFEPFFSTKEIGVGTGLGLFVCRNVVRGLSGDVTVSDRPGGGAVFRVTVPASSRAAAATRAPVALPETTPGGRHIVVIEDDTMVGRALSLQLRTVGYRVTVIPDGETARDTLGALGDVDLIYCDLMMTGMTGMELAQVLAAEVPEIARKMVFMTGGAFSPRAREFVARHADRTVDKPFDNVAETIRRLDR